MELNKVEKTVDELPDIKWMSWNQIASASGLGELMGNSKYKILRRAMKARGRTEHPTVRKDELPEHIAWKRVKWAERPLGERTISRGSGRRHITDECHFTWGPEGKPVSVRKKGERYKLDHIYSIAADGQKKRTRDDSTFGPVLDTTASRFSFPMTPATRIERYAKRYVAIKSLSL